MTTDTSPPIAMDGPGLWSRTTTGPVVDMAAEVVSIGEVGLYRRLDILAPEAAMRAVPGQFLTLDPQAGDHLLPRPFSIASADPEAGTVSIVFATVGAGTEHLAEIASVGHAMRVVAPIGTGYRLASGPAILVGGGYGAAPLTWLADRLSGDAHLLVGAATRSRLCLPDEADEVCASVNITTDDGSLGEHGLVTALLPELIRSAGATTVYACGPMAMLKAVGEQAAELGVACQVAVEEHMACGVGVCMTCVVPIRDGDDWQHEHVCVEGPVVDFDQIAWDQTRWA